MENKNPIKNQFASLLRDALHHKKITQEELAKKLDVKRSTVAQWTTGRNMPPGDKMIQLARELELVEDFFPGYIKESNLPHQASNRQGASFKKGVLDMPDVQLRVLVIKILESLAKNDPELKKELERISND